LIDQVVVHRVPRAEVQTRIGWQGGATTPVAVPVAVGACAALPGATAMEHQRLARCAAGHPDEAIAAQLTPQGSRSPQRPQVLPSTGSTMRRKPGRVQQRQQAHPRQVPGCLTVPQRARRLGVAPPGLDDRRANGRSQRAQEPATGLSLFPEQPMTVEHLQQWPAGTRTQVCCRARPPATRKHQEEPERIFYTQMSL
jgi:hypothetical protein